MTPASKQGIGFPGHTSAAGPAREARPLVPEAYPFKNNVPDPLLSGKELPTFKFALDKSPGKVMGDSFGKEATVEELPISKGIAGVSMRLAPGVSRELHWHATAAEWAIVLEGSVRTTVVDPNGISETNDFEPGDVWYFPRGHGHCLHCLGDKPCHFLLIFDNGYFSEFGTFSITDWIGHVSPELLAKNFSVPVETFAKFPKSEVYFTEPKIPPAEQQTPISGSTAKPEMSHKYRLLAEEPHSVHNGGREWRLGADKFPISQTMTGVVLDLDPGAVRELHWHPTSDEWQYVVEGELSVTLFGSHGRYRTERLSAGDVAYVPQGYGHSVENVGDKPSRMIIAFNTGHYQAVDLSQWIAGQPAYLLAAHFGVPESTFAKFPHADVFIAPDNKKT